ncbi:MAG: HAD hydrolase-like protein [Ruminococcus sp.]|nr:HAD hydrolase-like protein [Ruminococcus sp.]
MSRYSVLLFDLDGTLTDSREGIMNCFRHTADIMGAHMPENPGVLLGPPLGESFEKYFGMDSNTAQEAVKVYRERYGTKGLFENHVYEGVPEMLEKLKDNGFRLAVATCKAQVFAERILEKFGLSRYFEFIGGAGIDGSRTSKTEVIEYVLDNIGSPRKDSVLMIGDRDNDVAGAMSAGIKCMGVLWGYGSERELALTGAAYIARTPDHAAELLLAQ